MLIHLIWQGSDFHAADPAFSLGLDHGFQRGWGVFETMLAVGSEIPFWSRHWARLQFGARKIEIPVPSEQALLRAVQNSLPGAAQGVAGSMTSPPCFRLRLTITAGQGAHWTQPGEQSNGALTGSLWSVPPIMAQQPGLRLLTYPHPFSTPTALQGCKHTSYLPWLLAARFARNHDGDDAVLVQPNGEVIETSHRNLFVWRDNQLWTPPLSSGCLPGVMRALVLESASRLGLTVQEAPLTVACCLQAECLFVTSAITFCQIVREWDGQTWNVASVPPQLGALESDVRAKCFGKAV